MPGVRYCHEVTLLAHIWWSSLQALYVCSLVIHECGQVMYVAMPYFLFMEAVVSHLIHGGTFLIIGAHVSQF